MSSCPEGPAGDLAATTKNLGNARTRRDSQAADLRTSREDGRDMMQVLRYLNLAVAFLLELAVLLAAGYRGFTLPIAFVFRIIVGLGAPILLAVLWGLFASPRAAMPLHGAANAAFQIGWFGVGVLALAITGHAASAIALAVAYVLNATARLLSNQ